MSTRLSLTGKAVVSLIPPPMKTSIPLLAVPLLAGALQLGAASIPYTNDFSGTGSNTAFTNETTDAQWELNGGAYRNTIPNSSVTVSSASTSITGVAGNAFTMETQFTISSFGNFNSNGGTLGFGVLSLSATFAGTNTASSYYLVDWLYGKDTSPDVGRLRILALGDTTGFTATNSVADHNADANHAATLGTTYTLRLEGTYAENGTLSMTLGLFDATGTTQIGTSATATDLTPLTGEYFGYRNRIGLGGGTSLIDFDNFSLTSSTIPEPSAFALLGGLGAFGLAATRRRRR